MKGKILADSIMFGTVLVEHVSHRRSALDQPDMMNGERQRPQEPISTHSALETFRDPHSCSENWFMMRLTVQTSLALKPGKRGASLLKEDDRC